MSLFQNSVVSKYLKNQNATLLVQKWEAYKNHFLNLKVQEDIKGLKEEQYQGEFLEDLFVKILGYTKPASSTETKFNLTTEYKNVKDSKKADGAIIINDKVIAVIELKGTNTTDLGKIETQAFGYKNNQPDCVYVITSNFEKIRFYIDNAIEFLEFNLFQLTKTEFELLYLCLAYDNLSKGIAKTIKDESVSQEDVITKKLYKDYSLFKRELYQNLVALNPQYEPIELFKKSQKLLDRFLFIFFAEDRNLLPTNLIFRINKEWQNLRTMRIEVSLYDRYKIYFNDLNSGAKVQLPAFSQTTSNVVEEHQIFAYNGGLFKADDILDHIKIDDAVLFKHTENLSNYDFASEVDVNILGHIFENSLNELDEIKAQLEGESIDKTKTKRKKDGVFYTPKYITKYIVENTIGKLCQEKKTELQLVDEDYTTDKKRQKKTLQALIDKVETYRSWLLQLTICDPACGSGAFLNQALDFLIAQHQYIDELKAKLFGDTFVLSDVETSILENNLFGVDLNEESVEIAKLSLWLRTAQPNRKLNDLSSNIQCGNSLIDDVAVAGDKAFNWQQAFEKVFAKGGFDVIIGNPPYISFQNINNNIRDYLASKYRSSTGKYDLYVLFIEKSIEILKLNGVLSLILPNKFILSNYGIGVKDIILENKITEIVDFKDLQIFDGATTYPCIITLLKNKIKDSSFNYVLVDNNPIEISGSIYKINQNELNTDSWQLGSNNDKLLLNKILNLGLKIKDISNFITQGIRTGKLDVYFNDITLNLIEINKLEKELIYPCFTGKNVKRYSTSVSEENDLILYPYSNKEPVEIDSFPNIKKYLEYKSEVLKNRKDSGKVFYQTSKKWFEFWDPKFITFDKPKIVFPDISSENNFYLDEEGIPFLNTCYSIYLKDENLYKPVLSILNSKLFLFYVKKVFPSISGGYFRYKTSYIENFCIPKISDLFIQNIIVLVDSQFKNNTFLVEILTKFQRTIQRKFELEDLSKKLQDWHLLSYNDFIKELAKKKVLLSLSQEAEWEDYFLLEQKQAVATKNQITATDKKIDAMVYELYGLSEEEIEIVENS
ncbi:Eco57I restriction-modification methylase domain-containing protein [Flavobacterium psychrophilum]|uniref:Eco57I restriction-modification methylase domain-containing protein n=1 Tax=Flavobacterium psychrophilum TaxID=96345 RepID=UPI001C8F7530|nr:TaqI-like C-terminal specificity domain-containing protein [Flavobacterium psychrophilum]QZK99752.1 Eco57I restriction-modification methylase domain-containing protein [Flavobacterium psychrophilum]